MTYPSINEYLDELRVKLAELPKDERLSIVEEIEGHLYDKISEVIEEGTDKELATRKVLSEFKSPEELSKEYLGNVYTEDAVTNKEMKNMVFTNLGVSGLAFLALPIFEGNLDIVWIILGGVLLVAGLAIILSKKEWNRVERKYMDYVPKVLLFVMFPASLLLFWIVNSSEEQLVMFSLYYMMAYWIILVIYYLIIKKVKTSM